MRCRDCPYGIEDFTLRTEMYRSVYGEYPDENRANESEQFVWCDKVGGKVYSFGHCSDWYEQDEENSKSHSQKRKLNKRQRFLKHRNHLRYLESVSGHRYPLAVIWEDTIRIRGYELAENPKPYYKRMYRGKRSKYLKRQSNKAIRRYKGELHKGYHCHRLYDFWWELT